MKTNPPTAADAPMVAKMARIGIVPGQDFDATKLGLQSTARRSADVPKLGVERIMGLLLKAAGDRLNGWLFFTKAGQLRHRLHAARAGHPHRPGRQPAAGRRLSDCRRGTHEGEAYDGAKKYVMRFAKGKLPPGRWASGR